MAKVVEELRLQVEALQRKVDGLEMKQKRRQYCTAAERRAMIIEAARSVMAEGIFSLDAVAARCEVETSVSLIKHYFPGGRIGLQDAVNELRETRRRAKRRTAA